MSGPVGLVVALLGGYLAGSIPVGLLLLKARRGPDPRTVGSGNIGATNVTRAGGRRLGFLTLVLDALKAFVPALAFGFVSPEAGAAAGAGAVAGHCFPPWLRFSGGKGVACQLGVSLAIGTWLAPLAFAVAWIMGTASTRVVSVGSLAASWAAPVGAWFARAPDASVVALGLGAALVTVRHRSNLTRLVRGEEPRVKRRPPAMDDAGSSDEAS